MENCVDFGCGLEFDCFDSTIEPLCTLIYLYKMHKDSEQHEKKTNKQTKDHYWNEHFSGYTLTHSILWGIVHNLYIRFGVVVGAVSCLDLMVSRFPTVEMFGHKHITDPKMVTLLMVCVCVSTAEQINRDDANQSEWICLFLVNIRRAKKMCAK